jgi:thioredoxin reductase
MSAVKRVLIVGVGMSGMTAGIALKRRSLNPAQVLHCKVPHSRRFAASKISASCETGLPAAVLQNLHTRHGPEPRGWRFMIQFPYN